MKPTLLQRWILTILNWFDRKPDSDEIPPSNVEQIQTLAQPGDVILIEGQSTMSQAIKYVTESAWTHAALYIGSLNEVENQPLRELLHTHNIDDPTLPLLTENAFEKIVKVIPLEQYRKYHMRLCRPINLSKERRNQVIAYAISSIGYEYSTKQLLHLLKLLFRWIILPHRIFAKPFRIKEGRAAAKTSPSLLAAAFDAVKFPILPNMSRDSNGIVQLTPTTPTFFAPKYFDYSPYFEIIKYPLFKTPAEKVYDRMGIRSRQCEN